MADKISTTVAQNTLKEVSKEVRSLEATSIISLYEIDLSEIKINLNLGSTDIAPDLLRFHGNESIGQKKILFRGDTYHPTPIISDGFEINSTGSMPRPTLFISSLKGVLEEAEGNEYFASLKRAVLELDNMIGAKVTRVRTFYKFLDAANNLEGVGDFTSGTGNNPEFPKEVYFIERKISEDTDGIQFELSSVLEMENFKLPGRVCLSTRCTFSYRGEGCCYEFKAKGNAETHGGSTDHLPDFAPPIADDEDQTIVSQVSTYDSSAVTNSTPTLYSANASYSTTDVVYITKDGINYYYVAKAAVPAGFPPPHTDYWVADRCSKTMKGCKLRWGLAGSAKKYTNPPTNTITAAAKKLLPFGGFPGTNTKISSL